MSEGTFAGFARALHGFWSSFVDEAGRPIPAFAEGCVPESQSFPYITYPALRPRPLGQASFTVCCWCWAEEGLPLNAQRAHILGSLAAALPENGRVLRFPEGYALLYPDGPDFLAWRNDSEHRALGCGRAACVIKYYGL